VKHGCFVIIGFEVLTAVILKSSGFWDITPCSSSRVIRMAEFATCFHAGFMLGLFFDPEDGSDMFVGSVHWLSTEYTALHPRR
jgi:hypothetical protein